MGLVAKEPAGGGDFKPVPTGVHQAVCVAIWDLGTQHNPIYNRSAHKIMIMWEFPEHRIDIEKEGQPVKNMPMVLSKEYTLSLHRKADLRKDLESWRERAFTEKELQGFHLKVLLGVNCMIQVMHNTKGEGENKRTYANVNTIMKLPKTSTALDPEHPVILFEIDSGEPIPEATPDWIADKIRRSEEYQMQHPQGSNPGAYPGAQYNGGTPPYDPEDPGYDEDDIPF